MSQNGGGGNDIYRQIQTYTHTYTRTRAHTQTHNSNLQYSLFCLNISYIFLSLIKDLIFAKDYMIHTLGTLALQSTAPLISSSYFMHLSKVFLYRMFLPLIKKFIFAKTIHTHTIALHGTNPSACNLLHQHDFLSVVMMLDGSLRSSCQPFHPVLSSSASLSPPALFARFHLPLCQSTLQDTEYYCLSNRAGERD